MGNIIGQILIFRQGSVKLNIKSKVVTKKASHIDLYHRDSRGRESKSKGIRFNEYRGNANDVTVERLKCVQYLPITEETWSWWMKNPPSYAEMKKAGKNTRKEQVMAFMNSSEFKKATHHAADLVHDINHGRNDYDSDFTIMLT